MDQDHVHSLYETLARQIKTLLNYHLQEEPEEVSEEVRERLQEQFRFWKDAK